MPTSGNQPETSDRCSDQASRRIGGFGIILLSLTATIVSILLLYSLLVFWPTSTVAAPSAGPGEAPLQSIRYFVWTAHVSRESLFFVVVAVAGMLGGSIHSIRSLTWYIGNRDLRYSWVPFNLMLPVIGALGGTIFYLVLRAGLFSPSTSADQASPFGFAAVAALVGLFSEQALEKLRQVATHVFADPPTGKDHIEPTPPP